VAGRLGALDPKSPAAATPGARQRGKAEPMTAKEKDASVGETEASGKEDLDYANSRNSQPGTADPAGFSVHSGPRSQISPACDSFGDKRHRQCRTMSNGTTAPWVSSLLSRLQKTLGGVPQTVSLSRPTVVLLRPFKNTLYSERYFIKGEDAHVFVNPNMTLAPRRHGSCRSHEACRLLLGGDDCI
jgi:hypothetical protein